MEFNFDTGRIYGGIQSIDTSVLPPLGGLPGVLTIEGTGALRVPVGTTLEQPATPTTGMLRFNVTKLALEVFDGTTWSSTSGDGTVTYVQATTSGTGLSVTGGPITTSGTFTFSLNSVLQGLASLNNIGGFVVQTSPGVFDDRTITGVAGNIAVTNGDGISGNPAIGLATIGTPVSTSFSKITTDVFGRVIGATPVTTSDISTLVDSVYVNSLGDNVLGNLVFTGGATVTGIPTPVNGSDVVSKDYADALIQGLSYKQAVRVATTTNIVLNGTQTIDGVILGSGDRVLVKDQTDPTANGIYLVSNSAWSRTSDANISAELDGAFLFVTDGTLYKDTSWAQITTSVILGTSNIIWSQFAGAGTYTAGNGITLTGSQFSLSSPVSASNGGTGSIIAPSAGEILIGTSTGVFATGLLGSGAGIAVNSTSGNISITNTGVISFNTRVGAVTLESLDVSSALGYIPLSVNGGTINGDLTVSGDLTASGAGSEITLIGGVLPGDPAVISVSGTDPDIGIDIQTTGMGVVTVNGSEVLTTASEYVSKIIAGSNIVISPIAGTGDVTIESTGGVSNIVAGNGISVVDNVGDVVISNTGVTSVSFADGSSTPIFNISGSPVTSSGTLMQSLASQSANTAFLGPVSGNGQPSFRGIVYKDLPIKLYVENPTASTLVATGENASAFGDGASASLYGSKAFANGSFDSPGDAQHGLYVMRNELSTGTVGELFLDGVSRQLIFPNNSVVVFDVVVSARRIDAVGGGAGYKFTGVYRKDGSSATATFVGTPSKTIVGETDVDWDANVEVNTVTGALMITVLGQTGKTIRWVATVQTAEVIN